MICEKSHIACEKSHPKREKSRFSELFQCIILHIHPY